MKKAFLFNLKNKFVRISFKKKTDHREGPFLMGSQALLHLKPQSYIGNNLREEDSQSNIPCSLI